MYSAVYLGFALADATWHVVGLYLLYGVHLGVVSGAAKAFVADLVPADARGLAYGTYAAGIGVVSLPASLLGGVLWEGFGAWGGLGPSAPFAFGAAMAALATIVLLLAVPARA
jgi:MFS family permease